ncbi:MAG: 50S ribosomal protein L24 [Candidatus Liptonbacteria bacterium]|nr:50S ribosomal protein L24 [Candidatus Liptonbacteria bacterium]
MKIKKGDKVRILSGKDRGKEGPVAKAYPELYKITVEGLNLYKKRVRPRRQGEKGEMILLPRPLQVSKVMLLCPSCKKPTRVGSRLEGEKKVRRCLKCQAGV